jgi:hypothetical protein
VRAGTLVVLFDPGGANGFMRRHALALTNALAQTHWALAFLSELQDLLARG